MLTALNNFTKKRSTVKSSDFDFVTNSSVNCWKDRSGAVIGDRRLALFGHVRLLPEGAPAHDALQMSVELLTGTTSVHDWRGKPGRPRNSWLRGVLRDVHLTAQEAWTAADNREWWRAQRSSVDYAFWWWWWWWWRRWWFEIRSDLFLFVRTN